MDPIGWPRRFAEDAVLCEAISSRFAITQKATNLLSLNHYTCNVRNLHTLFCMKNTHTDGMKNTVVWRTSHETRSRWGEKNGLTATPLLYNMYCTVCLPLPFIVPF